MKFFLDKRELEEFKRWNEEHLRDHHDGSEPNAGTLGGRITYTFCTTTVAVMSGAECNVCHAAGKDKLDYMHCLN